MAARRVFLSSAILLLLLGFSLSFELSDQISDYQKFGVSFIINHGLLISGRTAYFLAGYDYLTRPRGRKYFSTRICRYPNAQITFNLNRLATSGDINPNPGPIFSGNSTNTLCSVCMKTVAKTHRAIECDLCFKWCHIKCGGVSPTEYRNLQNTLNFAWTCPTCILDLQSLPFANISNLELDDLNLNDSIHSGSLLNDSREAEANSLRDFLQP
ncbi:uncharacterized protein LOC116295689, partial [Actinia tenebrosa]|uniref:Uncharacterized protein LOC116295689 n=1 Tax=Actinia tenebrosa TaxID=6105 RepID=A0A6P8HST8_ACTTE